MEPRMLIPPRHGTIANTVDAGIPVNVLLDGVPVKDCVEYHMDESWVMLVKRDEDGLICVDGDDIVLERKLGSVTVEIIGHG